MKELMSTMLRLRGGETSKGLRRKIVSLVSGIQGKANGQSIEPDCGLVPVELCQQALGIIRSLPGKQQKGVVAPSVVQSTTELVGIVVDSLVAIWNTVATVSLCYDVQPPTTGDWFDRLCEKVLLLCACGKFSSWMKWHFAMLQYRVLNDKVVAEFGEGSFADAPAPPFQGERGGMFMGGCGYRWIRSILSLPDPERQKAVWSISQSKFIFPRPTKVQVAEKVKETFDKLTSVRDPTALKWSHLRAIREACSLVKNKVAKPFLLPSRSACFERSRDDGGQWGELISRRGPLPGHFLSLKCHGDCTEETLVADDQKHDEEPVLLHVRCRGCYMFDEDPEHFARVVDSRISDDCLQDQCVRLVGLQEAFKVRVISAGPAELYKSARSIWSRVYRGMRGVPCFELAQGKDLEASLLKLRPLTDGEYFVSGDYEAATDNLSPQVSLAVAGFLADQLGLSREERYVFNTSLVGHTLVHGGESRQQRWGQLMGSVTSFPVLCIANLATWIHAFHRRHHRWPTRQEINCGVRINGDDILFMADKELIGNWASVARHFGLIPSMGKNFVSAQFATINSKLFELDASGHLRRHYHVQFRLLFNSASRSEAEDKRERKTPELEREYGSIEDQFQLTLKAFAPSAHKEVLEIFTHHRFDTLSKEYKNVDWRRPRLLGGPGLYLPGFTPLELDTKQAFDAWAHIAYAVQHESPWCFVDKIDKQAVIDDGYEYITVLPDRKKEFKDVNPDDPDFVQWKQFTFERKPAERPSVSRILHVHWTGAHYCRNPFEGRPELFRGVELLRGRVLVDTADEYAADEEMI